MNNRASSENVSILKYIYDSHNHEARLYDLSEFIGSDYSARIDYLVSVGMIEQSDCFADGELSFDRTVTFMPSAYKLTVFGTDVLNNHLKSEQFRSDQKAKQRRKKKRNSVERRKNAIQQFKRDLLVAIISGIVVLIIERIVTAF